MRAAGPAGVGGLVRVAGAACVGRLARTDLLALTLGRATGVLDRAVADDLRVLARQDGGRSGATRALVGAVDVAVDTVGLGLGAQPVEHRDERHDREGHGDPEQDSGDGEHGRHGQPEQRDEQECGTQTTLRHRHPVRGPSVLLVVVAVGAARHRAALPAVALRDVALPDVALPDVALPDVALMSPVSG